MKIEGLNGIHQGQFVATLKNQLCNSARGMAVPMWGYGFDTLRLGLKKVNHPEANAKFMRILSEAIGAELVILKGSNHKLKSYDWLETLPKDVADSYTKIYKRPITTISSQFYHHNAVYVLRYKDAIVWILDHQKAQNLTLELYGLSQPQHNKGATKWIMLNAIMNVLPSYDKPKLLGYDFAIDSQMAFNWIIEKIAFPYVIEKLDKARGKVKYDLIYHNDDEESGTVYLQPKKQNKRAERVTIYDKQKKNGLAYPLVRFEFTRTCNFYLNSLNVLNEIAKIELSELCISTESLPMGTLSHEGN